MNGPEHYREAERLLGQAGHPRVITGISDLSPEDQDRLASLLGSPTIVFDEGVEFHDSTIAAAQVHATLALAAATVTRFAPTDTAAWNEVTR